MFEHACELGLEGVVSKVRDSAYPTGRSNDWVKRTCARRATLTNAGFALDGSKWDGLYVGRRKRDELVYAGKVDQGFDKVSAADLRKRLAPLVRKTQAFAKRVAHEGIWVEPKLLAEIEYGRSRRKAKSGTRSSAGCGKISDDSRIDYMLVAFPGRLLGTRAPPDRSVSTPLRHRSLARTRMRDLRAFDGSGARPADAREIGRFHSAE
jgi:hypothetical protein